MSASTSERWRTRRPRRRAAASSGSLSSTAVETISSMPGRRCAGSCPTSASMPSARSSSTRRGRAIAARHRATVAAQHARDARHAGAADPHAGAARAHVRSRARRSSSFATAAAASGRAHARMPARHLRETPGLGAQLSHASAQARAVERRVLDDHRTAGRGEMLAFAADGRPWHGDRVRAARAGRPPRAPRPCRRRGPRRGRRRPAPSRSDRSRQQAVALGRRRHRCGTRSRSRAPVTCRTMPSIEPSAPYAADAGLVDAACAGERAEHGQHERVLRQLELAHAPRRAWSRSKRAHRATDHLVARRPAPRRAGTPGTRDRPAARPGGWPGRGAHRPPSARAGCASARAASSIGPATKPPPPSTACGRRRRRMRRSASGAATSSASARASAERRPRAAARARRTDRTA